MVVQVQGAPFESVRDMHWRNTTAARALLWVTAILGLVATMSALGGCSNTGTAGASDDTQRPRPAYSRLPVR